MLPPAPLGVPDRASSVSVSHDSNPPRPGDDLSSDVTSDPGGAGTGPTNEAAPVHREWAHLRLIEEIGRGGFGRVYRAWDTTLAREVALKLVAIPELDAEAASEVLHEGRMLARVRHPNVVTVYGALQIGQEFGLWMELVRGRSLADVVRKDGPLGAEEAAVVALSVCRALAAVHVTGLVHRDVKAQNVMREAGGRILLMDFGAGWDPALPVSQSLGRAPGTPNYMAPEVIAGDHATPSSDIYSVGVLLYFLVTGRHPFEGRTLAEIAVGQGLRRRRLLADDRPDLPEGFMRVVDRALAIDPKDRFASAGALIHELTARPSWDPRALELTDLSVVNKRADEDQKSHSASAERVQPRPSPRRITIPAVIALTLIGAVAIPWVLGFLMSMAFNVTLGRTSEFTDDSGPEWWVWGVRSLVAPVVYVALAVGLRGPVVAGARFGMFLLRSLWAVLAGTSSLLHRVSWELSGALDRLWERLRLDDLGVRAQLLLPLQVLLLVAVVWRFADLIGAYTNHIADAPAGAMAALQPDNVAHHVAYGIALDGLILLTVLSWLALIQARARLGQQLIDGSAVAGMLILTASVVMLTVPYRIIWHNEFERVELESVRCYNIGKRGGDLLLHCPDLSPPRNKVVAEDDARLTRPDVVESIFTPASDGQ
jgi:eukaryotic-like serine/threonine-protein kinase